VFKTGDKNIYPYVTIIFKGRILTSLVIFCKELDASRACMSDIFMNTNGFSTRTVAAIAKEVIYKVYTFLNIRMKLQNIQQILLLLIFLSAVVMSNESVVN
jgi:hypothetical protein